MTDTTTGIELQVAPGAGRVCRRSKALLFDPSGDNVELVTEFDRATSDDAAITAVKQHLIDSEFAGPPVVVVDWHSGEPNLLVFGDVSVHSSAPAAPMVSGSGSGTWIERRLGALELGTATEAHVWCGDETDGDTDLRLGVARAGGIRVVLVRASEGAPREIPPPEPEELNPRPIPAPAPAPAASAPAATPPAAPAAVPAPAATTPAAPAGAASSPAAPAAVPAPAATTPAAPAVNGAVSTPPAPSAAPAPPTPASPPPVVAAPPAASAPSHAPSDNGAIATAADPFTDPVTDDFEDQLTEPADRIEGLAEARRATSGLVEALRCENGHSNPPQYLVCRTCAVDLDPDGEVELIAQPSVGHLRFASGNVVEVDGPRVIGRKPSSDDGTTRPVVVDHAEVSRTHVEVALQGWAVLVTDAGSRNGTWVIPPSDPTPVKLEAGVPYQLEHGTTVHLGGPEAGFTYDIGID